MTAMQLSCDAEWFVYVARCSDGSLYTGIARDVAKRLAAHDAGKGAKYTRGRGPLVVCAVSERLSKVQALRVERSLKALRRGAKEQVIASAGRFEAYVRGHCANAQEHG